MKESKMNKRQLDQKKLMDGLLKNIKEFEKTIGEDVSSIKLDLDQNMFEICLKSPTGKMN